MALQYKRTPDFTRGTFRVRGDTLELFPAHYEDRGWRIGFFGDEIESLTEFDPLTGKKTNDLSSVKIYANSHYVTPRPTLVQSIKAIKSELKTIGSTELYATGRLLEAQRLEQRTTFDLEMLEATGSCQGIENYSRYLTGRRPASRRRPCSNTCPTTRWSSPTRATSRCRRSAPCTKATSGARRRWPNTASGCPPASTTARCASRNGTPCGRRPCTFRPRPAPWEMDRTAGVFVEQVIRPTGLIDPPVESAPRPHPGRRPPGRDQAGEPQKGYRTLVTVLTKRMAEDLTEYLHEHGVRVRYMHSDIDTIERIEIIRDLRLGVFDALVGINLLREGLDIPECALVAVLDADKEGFLRSETSPGADHRPRRPQRRRPRRALCRQDHRLHGARHGRDRPPARKAGRLQPRTRHHARLDQARHPGHPGLGLRGRPRHGRHRPRVPPAP